MKFFRIAKRGSMHMQKLRMQCCALACALCMACASAGARDLHGPTQSRGIESVETAAVIELGGEFPGMRGRQLRARFFTLAPGAVIAQHTHDARPAYAYILSGEVTEHSDAADAPIVHAQGDLAIEKSGITHWLENTSDAPVRALVIDIFTPESE